MAGETPDNNMQEGTQVVPSCDAVEDAIRILNELLPQTDVSNLISEVTEPANGPEFIPFDPTTGIGNPLYNNIPDPKDITDLTVIPNTETIRKGLAEGNDGDFDRLSIAFTNQLVALQESFALDAPGKAAVLSAALPSLLSVAVQYNLTKDSNRWDAVTAQYRARETEINALIAQYRLGNAKNEAEINKLTAATTIVNLAVTNKQYAITCEKLRQEEINTETVGHQRDLAMEQVLIAQDQRQQILAQTKLIQAQETAVKAQYDNTNVLPGSTIDKQNILLGKQAEAYDNDAFQKFARVFLDVYAINKSADSGVPTPGKLGTDATNTVITELARKLGVTNLPST